MFAHILTPIEDVLTDVLVWLHNAIGISWAWSVIVLVALIRIVILPLTLKQIRSMQRLAQYAPQLKALQQKYKHDKQRMNEEVMKFYREHKVNPAASCLPILPQIPIFIALFYTLRDFEKDVLPTHGGSVSFLNGLIPNITDKVTDHWTGWMLLVIYVGSQVLSMLLSTTAVQSKMQRYLFMALPILFIPFILRFPVGLMAYWITTNLWTIGQGIVTRRLYPRPVMEPPKKSSRTPPKDGDGGGNGAARPKPTRPTRPAGEAKKPVPASSSGGSGSGQRPVRRRKKKGGTRR
jgi:YidC/Oxa1 family membrane protein insertase